MVGSLTTKGSAGPVSGMAEPSVLLVLEVRCRAR